MHYTQVDINSHERFLYLIQKQIFEVDGARVGKAFVHNRFVTGGTSGTRALDHVTKFHVPVDRSIFLV